VLSTTSANIADILTNKDVLLEIGQEHIPETAAQEGNKYRQIIRIKAVHFMTIFAVIYIGVEVTLGGMFIFPVNSFLYMILGRLDRNFHHS